MAQGQRPARHRKRQQLLGSYLYRRIMLVFRVSPQRLNRLLPSGWESVDHPGWGNVAAGFCEVFLYQNPAGRTIRNARRFYLPINGTARNSSGATANFRYLTFADGDDPFPGCGAQICTVEHRGRVTSDHRGRLAFEHHRYTADDGTLLELELSYEGGPVERESGEMAVRCPHDASVNLTYWNDEPQEVVYAQAEGVDRRRTFRYVLRAPVLDDLFDGTERLLAVVAVPTSERRVFSRPTASSSRQ